MSDKKKSRNPISEALKSVKKTEKDLTKLKNKLKRLLTDLYFVRVPPPNDKDDFTETVAVFVDDAILLTFEIGVCGFGTDDCCSYVSLVEDIELGIKVIDIS